MFIIVILVLIKRLYYCAVLTWTLYKVLHQEELKYLIISLVVKTGVPFSSKRLLDSFYLHSIKH